MNLTEVGAELKAALEAVSGLRVQLWTANNAQPPYGVVGVPDEVTYDEAYGRGMDRFDRLPVMVVTGRVNDGRAVARAVELTDGSGTGSVKVALEAGAYTTCDVVHVVNAQFDAVTISGVDYIAATFEIDIVGSGS